MFGALLLFKSNVWELHDASKGVLNLVINFRETSIYYPCQSSYDCTYYSSQFAPGIYKVEVWGANGGSSYTNTDFRHNNGQGGYSQGVLILEYPSTVFVFIGGQGESSKIDSSTLPHGGYNGGGDSTWDDRDTGDQGSGGGGATDLRINSTDLESQVIVAGGAGGNGFDTGWGETLPPAFGGGLEAAPPRGRETVGIPASQTYGYLKGLGQNGIYRSGGTSGGGGGGYFGGLTIEGTYGGQGGGGSGYIGGVTSYNGIIAQTIPGNETFPPKSNNEGNVFAKITLIEKLPKATKFLGKFKRKRCFYLFCLKHI